MTAEQIDRLIEAIEDLADRTGRDLGIHSVHEKGVFEHIGMNLAKLGEDGLTIHIDCYALDRIAEALEKVAEGREVAKLVDDRRG